MERKIIKEKRGGKKLEWKGQAVSHSMRTFSRMPSDNPPRESPRSAVTDEESRGVGSPVCAIMAGRAMGKDSAGTGRVRAWRMRRRRPSLGAKGKLK